MKSLHKIFKYILRVMLGLLALVVLVMVLLYIPGIQNFVKGKAEQYVERNMGMKLSVGRVLLKFPLDLAVEKIYFGKTEQDTMLSADLIQVNVTLAKLLKKEIEVRRLVVENAALNFGDSLSGMRMKVAVHELNLRVDRLNLAKQEADIPMVSLRGGIVAMHLGESQPDTTEAGEPVRWKFKVGEVVLDSIDYVMNGLPMGQMRVGIGEGRLRGAEIQLGGQTVNLDSIRLTRGYCELLTESDSTSTEGEVIQDTMPSVPWEVYAGSVELADCRFLMKPRGMMVSEERFPEAIRLSALSLQVDSVFNRGTEIAAIVQRLRVKEGNGLDLRNLSCRVNAGSDKSKVSDLSLKTAYSQIKMNLQAGSGLTDFGMTTPLQLSVNGTVGGKDILLFMPDTNEMIEAFLQNKTFSLAGLLDGAIDQLNINHLNVGAGDDFLLESKGKFSSVTDMEQMIADYHMTLTVRNGRFFEPFLASGGEAGFVVPDNLTMNADLKMADQTARAEVEVKPREGSLNVIAGYGLKDDSYYTVVRLREFALDEFMPKDSLGEVTATLSASGKGLDWKTASAKANLVLTALQYNGYDYKDLTLNATMKEGALNGELRSANKELDMDMKFHLVAEKDGYKAKLESDIRNVDLKGLHFMTEDLAFSLGLNLTGVLNADSTSSLNVDFSNIILKDTGTRQLGDLNLSFAGECGRTRLGVDAGDLSIKFNGEGNGYLLADQFAKAGALLSEQLAKRDFNMEQLDELLPNFRLTITAAQKNILNSYLKNNGMRFKRIGLDLETGAASPFKMDVGVYGLDIEGFVMDSILMDAYGQGVALRYAVNVFGAKDQLEVLSQFTVEGFAEHDQVNVRLRERENKDGEIFNIGANIAFQDSAFSVSISPDPLVLGYVPWQINRGNFIRIKQGEIPAANLLLLSEDKRIRLVSEQGVNQEPESLVVDIKAIDLGHISKVLTFIPDMSGLLGIDLQMHSKNKVIDVGGNITVNEFNYLQERIGNLDMGIQYKLSQQTEHDVDFTLSVDGVQALLTQGKVMTGADDQNIDLNIGIPELPLRLAGAFTPPGMIRLGGNMVGAFRIKGSMNNPLINGSLSFRDGEVEVLPVGTTFKIDTSAIKVQNNLLAFNHFGLIAPNKQRLELQGNVDFASFSTIKMDASVSARNFQAMKVKENTETMVYGQLFVDVSATLKGILDDLKIRGNINLLDNSEVYYTLKSSPLSVTDRSVDLVRFVSFRDSTEVAEEDELKQIHTMSLDLLMSVNIAPLVNLNVLLSANGQNRVSINGGGSLTYTLSPVGESRLVGRYVLTSGIVSYGLPVIGQKDFTIQDGNYVEWTGDLANPTLNIMAAETISASVTDDSQKSRLVNFKAIIRITSTLEKPDITFDLAAEGDITIQNQLAAMTPEERSREAMNMMIYGSYSGPGTVAKSNASDNAINNFVERELNQWSRKHLKNMDLTFGINTYNQVSEAGESKKTDYSYQFSKRLFNNRVRVKVGGRISTDNDPAAGGVEENLVDDIAVEYLFGKNPNFFLKIFRHTGYESVLEGEVTQTGIGVVLRKNFQKFRDIFRRKKKAKVESKETQQTEYEKSDK
ncbi:translocation/assembly module TamB domain-containing protein [Butyricimonas synergistica]|uniref:translocation/assembly module TamB domain-containing protein n=1 Tax=Butyricimonas synergistica TaxID=544644 RepID=UPI0022E2B076|nr:translocation/assembly module TamB domain-containing protein [Butyricimonas synergistica]